MRRILLLGAALLVACGGEDGGDGAKAPEPEDYVEPALLAQAENEHQRLCLMASAMILDRTGACGEPLTGDTMAWKSFCLTVDMPIEPETQRQADECFDLWAAAPCDDLRVGAAGSCALLDPAE